MKPDLVSYLKVVGFNVVWGYHAKVNIHSDPAMVAFARKYHRILVCHDQHRKKAKIPIILEIYNNGGKVIEVTGSSGQPALTSLAKIIIHRIKWKDFFNSNDGIVRISDANRCKTYPRKDLINLVGRVFEDPSIPSISPKAPPKKRTKSKTKTKTKTLPSAQLLLEQNTKNGI